jgi:colicin import membrane protein
MEPLPYSDIPSDTVKRITSAADQLYEEGGRQAFPNVDAVRRRARVNMNDASGVMRVWRRAQTAAAAPLTTAVPLPVQEASQALLASVWKAATTTANANLQAAQAGWELERTEAETSREQLATAFDRQSEELLDAQRAIETLERKLSAQSSELSAARTGVDLVRQKLISEEAKTMTAAARAEEIAKRADDLKNELEKVHANAAREREYWKHRLDAAESTIARMIEELRRQSASCAESREELARMHGQKEGTESHRHIALVAAADNGGAHRPGRKKLSNTSKPKGNT